MLDKTTAPYLDNSSDDWAYGFVVEDETVRVFGNDLYLCKSTLKYRDEFLGSSYNIC